MSKNFNTKLLNKKPKKIVFFQWFFLFFTGFIYYLSFGFAVPNLVSDTYSLFSMAIALLALLSSLGISISLFYYPKSSKRLIMTFAVILALIWIFCAQESYFYAFLHFLGINMSDIQQILSSRYPNRLASIQNDLEKFHTLLSVYGLIVGGLTVYGLPLLFLYVFSKLIKSK